MIGYSVDRKMRVLALWLYAAMKLSLSARSLINQSQLIRITA